MEKKMISLMTPCYNEEGNIRDVYTRVTDVMKGLDKYDYEYVIIDNCSTDSTQSILREIASTDSRVKVIFNNKNFGPARSGMYGFLQTSGDVSICFAADLQDPPELIPEFIRRWENGNKIVWGQKAGSEETRMMYNVRKLYYRIMKSISSNEQYENATGFGLYDKEVVDLLREYVGSRTVPNIRNMISEYGYHIDFVSYHQPQRKWGRSSYNLISYMNIALNDMVNTSRLPLRVATYLGGFVTLLSFIVAVFYIVLKIVYWDSYNIGTATQIVGMFFLGGIQLMFLGIIGEYVGEILERMNPKPMVVEKERINF